MKEMPIHPNLTRQSLFQKCKLSKSNDSYWFSKGRTYAVTPGGCERVSGIGFRGRPNEQKPITRSPLEKRSCPHKTADLPHQKKRFEGLDV
jgi:hypothetical protein